MPPVCDKALRVRLHGQDRGVPRGGRSVAMQNCNPICIVLNCIFLAALIGSMPSNLVHRTVINLVKGNKRVKAKNRAMVKTLESALQRARLEIEQLECAAASRPRQIEHKLHLKFLQRKMDSIRNSLSSAESENRRLATAAKNAEKNKCRLEAKVHNQKSCYIILYRALNYLLLTD
uniref:Uncharacterized protein n=1 Tax=Phytophthora infestans TaxID=4787 RepID=Q572F4_PHYIN|nr:hypothetical protein PI49.0300 [Phytophthora infestans]